MELRQFDMNLLVAFDWLMQEQSVSRAAERMFVTQSAMSHTLQRLRQQLDDPLLVKTPSGMKPTERAMALIEPVRAVLREVESLIRQPEVFDPARSQRRFVMAATDYMDFLLIPPLIERIVKEAPGIDIQVKRTDLPFPEKELETGELDIVLGFEAILKPAGYLNCRKLFEDRMTCLLRQDHPSIQGDTVSLDDYVGLKHMLISRTGTRTGVIDDWLADSSCPTFFPRLSSLPTRICCCPYR